MTDRVSRSWFAALLALIGGGAIVAGCLLTWLDVRGGVSVGSVSITGTPKGNELLAGKEALVGGIAVVFLALLLLLNRGARTLLGLLVVIGGIIAVAIGAYVVSSPRDRYIDFAVQKGALAGQADEVNLSLVNLFDVSGQEADLGVGLFVMIGGGVLSVVGGLTLVAGRRKPTPVDEVPEPTEPEPEGLPEEWLAARAKEAAARSVAVEEPPQQVLVAETAGPPLPDPPPWPEDAAPLPEGPESPPEPENPPEPESPPEEERAARAEEVEAPSDAPKEPAPAPEPVTETVATPEPSEEPVKPDDRSGWSKPLPDDWTAKPAKRRRRRRS